MTAPINATQFDFNADGKIDQNDVALGKLQGVTVPTAYVGKTVEALNLQLNNEDDDDTANTTTAAADTLNGIKTQTVNLEAHIKDCQEAIQQADDDLEELLPQQADLQEELEATQAEYESNASQLTILQNQLQAQIKIALAASSSLQQETDNAVNTAVNQATEDYANGEYPGQDLKSIIQFKLNNLNVDSGAVARIMSGGDSISAGIAAKCGNLENIASDLRNVSVDYNSITDQVDACNGIKTNARTDIGLSTKRIEALQTQRTQMIQQIVTQYHVAATGGDPATIQNAQVQKLGEFLNANLLETMPFEDACEILGQSFSPTIAVNNGQFSIPYGHDDQARAIFTALTQKIKDLYGENAGRNDVPVDRTDPIGFELDNIKVDFVIDKDNDNVFDGKNEFLGAQNGWQEMLQYDDNKDGLISGDELKDMKVLKTGADGKQTFSTADQVGIDKIDLNSYKSKNEKLAENNILAGTFNLAVNGQDVQGKQTLDTDAYLQKTYGNTFGKNIKQNSVDLTPKNPFVLSVDYVNTKSEYLKAKMSMDTATNAVGSDQLASQIYRDGISVNQSSVKQPEKAEDEESKKKQTDTKK